MEKLQQFIDSTFKWLFTLGWTTHVCFYLICSPAEDRPNQQSCCKLVLSCLVILAQPELLQLPVPIPCQHTQGSPWAAVCLLSQAVVATAMWLWLTVRLTTPFMRHLLAVNHGGHPGAIDGAVSTCEMCLSKPTHSATPSPCLGSLTFVYCPLSTFFLPSISFSFFLSQSVCLLPASHQGCDSPLIPDPITESLDTHLSSSNPQVFFNGVLHKHFCRWLRPVVHVVFTPASCFSHHPVTLSSTATSLLSFSRKFLFPSASYHAHSPFISIPDRWQGLSL